MSKKVELIKEAMHECRRSADEYNKAMAKTKERNLGKGLHAAYQALSESAEDAHVENNVDALEEYMASTGQARKHNKSIIASLFDNGKPGQYVTRSKTLVEKVASVVKK